MLIRSSMTTQRTRPIPRLALVGILLLVCACNTSQQRNADTEVLQSIQSTAPLSVVMAEDLAALRAWADGRTVNAG